MAGYVVGMLWLLGCTTLGHPKDDQLLGCESDDQCVVMEHSHCCGATKKPINRKYLDYYRKTPAMQKTDDPELCAVVGLCRDDSTVRQAVCRKGRCELLWPK